MGRPLKISKAQAVLTITGTNGTTEEVTVSQTLSTLGIIAGMSVVPATTTGGLTGGTTYWILKITGASTFTVSATPLNANPTFTPVNLSTTTSTTVAATVGLVDSGFSNPDGSNTATNSTSYGVVGGNTAFYGSQTLCQVAIGQVGVGTMYGDPGNLNVYGQGTDFSNTLSVGSALQVAVANINGSTDYVDVGFVDTVTGYITVAVANTSATGNVIGTSGNAQTLFVGAPVTFDANTGGLVAGVTYFVKTIANAAAFTVSNTQYGPTRALTTGTTAANATIDVVVLDTEPPITFTNANYIFADNEPGYIVRQKGKTKYLATGSTTGLTAQCYTANVANTALTPNTMNIIGTYANSATVYIQSLNDYQSQVFYNTNDANANPDIIATFGTAYAANTYPGTNPIDGQVSNVSGQPNPIVTINNA